MDDNGDDDDVIARFVGEFVDDDTSSKHNNAAKCAQRTTWLLNSINAKAVLVVNADAPRCIPRKTLPSRRYWSIGK